MSSGLLGFCVRSSVHGKIFCSNLSFAFFPALGVLLCQYKTLSFGTRKILLIDFAYRGVWKRVSPRTLQFPISSGLFRVSCFLLKIIVVSDTNA